MEDRTENGDQSDRGHGVHGVRPAVAHLRLGPGVRRARLRHQAVDLQRRRVLLPAPEPQHAPAARQEDRLRRRAAAHAPYTGAVTSPVSWDVAERVATWVGTRGSLLGPPGAGTLDAATTAQLEADFSEATTRAEALVIEATGLRPATGSAGALVARPGRLGPGQRVVVPAPARARPREARHRRPAGPAGRGRPPGHRGPAGPGPGVDGHTGPGAVRPAAGRGGGHRRRGVLRGPEHRGPRAPPRISRPSNSGCGSPCTRSPTGASSPASPGCGPISSPSSTRPCRAWRPTRAASPRRCAGPRRPCGPGRTPSRRPGCSAWWRRPSSSR